MESRLLPRQLAGRVALLHAAYFAVGGFWAVTGKRSFQAVTGPKVDYWLVRTVGGLLTVVGVVIGMASMRGRITPEIRWLAIGTSAVLTLIDLVYTRKNRIRKIYLLDAVANLGIIAGWLRLPAGDLGRADSEYL